MSSRLPFVSHSESPVTYSWRDVWAIAREHRWALALAHLLAIGGMVAMLPIPLLFPALVDEVLLNDPGLAVRSMNRFLPLEWQRPIGYIIIILGVTLALRLAILGMNVLEARQFATISSDLIYRLRRSFLSRLGEVSVAELETLGSGAVSSHFITDVGTIDTFIRSTISRFLVNVLTLVGVASVLFWMNWKLALVILLLNPIVLYLSVVLGRWVKLIKEKENATFAAFQDALTETLDAFRQLRADNRDGWFLSRLAERARAVRDQSASFAWKSSAAGRISFLVFLFGFDLFRAASMLAVLLSGLTIGQMMAVFNYLWFMMNPLQELLNIQYSYYAASAALGRINRLLQLKSEPRLPQLENPFYQRVTVGLKIESLRIAYRGARNVLDGVNLEVRPGERLAIIGASGAGKSTLVNALLGLYPASSGMIYFGDLPVTRIGWDLVRKNVVAVLQNPALLNDTVRANLTLGHDRPDQDIWRALETAQLAEDVSLLEGGLDASIGRQGVRLSGGQRQRLAIARLLLADPKVVILDEATSALDLETELRLHSALLTRLGGRTTLIVAHRLSALRFADRVVVLEAGRIAEDGTHDELLSQGGLYEELYRKR